MSEPLRPLLLDTHPTVWAVEDLPMGREARRLMSAAYVAGIPRFISPMTAWEVGMLESKRRLGLSLSPERWLEQVLRRSGVFLAALSPEVLVQSSFLPGSPPKDPVDRILAATAREFGYRLVTRDRELLAYAAEGHLQVIPC